MAECRPFVSKTISPRPLHTARCVFLPFGCGTSMIVQFLNMCFDEVSVVCMTDPVLVSTEYSPRSMFNPCLKRLSETMFPLLSVCDRHHSP